MSNENSADQRVHPMSNENSADQRVHPIRRITAIIGAVIIFIGGVVAFMSDTATVIDLWPKLKQFVGYETTLSANTLLRKWEGTYVGHSSRAAADDGKVLRDVSIVFSTVREDGRLEAECVVSSEDPGEGALTGSYHLVGYIDWETRIIELRGSDWIDQGDLVYKRQFRGRVDSEGQSINGTSSDDGTGENESHWTMDAINANAS